jgi:hypothetical protein
MLKIVQIWDPNREDNIEDIRNNPSVVSGIVIMGNVEADIGMIPDNQLEKIFSFCNSNSLPIHIITAGHKNDPDIIKKRNLKVRPNNLHIYYWSTYYLTQTLVRLITKCNYDYNKNLGYDLRDIETGLDVTDYRYKLICLNKAPKRHRMIILDCLEKYNLITNNAITFRELNQGMPAELYYWQQKEIFLDQTDRTELFNQEILPKEYKYSFMQIVTESHDDIFFLTEKTTIPLFFNKPFLVASCRHYHKRLEELGFQLYDELFDYKFDEEKDLRDRMEGVVKNAYRYKDTSLEELQRIHSAVKDKLIYNKKLAIKYASDRLVFPKIWNSLATEEYKDIPISNPYDLNNQLGSFTLQQQ